MTDEPTSNRNEKLLFQIGIPEVNDYNSLEINRILIRCKNCKNTRVEAHQTPFQLDMTRVFSCLVRTQMSAGLELISGEDWTIKTFNSFTIHDRFKVSLSLIPFTFVVGSTCHAGTWIQLTLQTALVTLASITPTGGPTSETVRIYEDNLGHHGPKEGRDRNYKCEFRTDYFMFSAGPYPSVTKNRVYSSITSIPVSTGPYFDVRGSTSASNHYYLHSSIPSSKTALAPHFFVGYMNRAGETNFWQVI